MPQAVVYNIKDRERIHPLRSGKSQAQSTTAAKPPSSGGALDDIESDLVAVGQMARVAVSVMEDTLDSNRNVIGGNPENYWIPDQHREMAIFTVVHLQEMVQKLEDRFVSFLMRKET